MKEFVRAIALSLIVVSGFSSPAMPGEGQDPFGRTFKLRILVDKVMQPEAGWVTEEWMLAEAAKAGFNVYSPRKGHDRMVEVQQVTRWCKKYGLYHMPWMRGTLTAPAGAPADGKRLVWEDGLEQPLWSPNADEFWEWTTRYIREYARISAEMPRLVGVFLDYENYAPGRPANCYSLSYDELIMGRFAQEKGIRLPRIEPAQRKGWLEERGLHEEFSKFQIGHWRMKCRALRVAVDQHNPRFRFCIYPAPGTPFMLEACYPEWATQAAPLILADACVYGRPSRFLPQREALAANRKKLLERMQIPKAAGIPFTYSGGIDPVVTGADPEFCGKNAVMISETTAGYWVFYEGPKYKVDHPSYFEWFAWANRAIERNDLDAWKEPRKTPEDWGLELFESGRGLPSIVSPGATGEKVEYATVKMRRGNLMVLACRKGQPVEIELRHHPVSRYLSVLVWDLRDAGMEKLASGTIAHGAEGSVQFIPRANGLYLLGASAGSCAYSVASSNVPLGLYAVEGLSLIHGAQRLYFKVPEGLLEFTVAIEGPARETGRVTVYNPAGAPAGTGQTSLKAQKAQIRVSTDGHSGKIWSLAITRADEGVLEDSSLRLDPRLPPALSLSPLHVFDRGKGR